MKAKRINSRRIAKLQEVAEKMGFHVVHIHADIKEPGKGPRIKFDMEDRGKK